jgi:hypothetical protein
LNILTKLQLQGQHPLTPGAITNNLTGALTALTALLQRVRVNQIDSNRLFRGQCEHSCSSCQLAETLSGRENEAQLNGGFKNSDILLGLSFGNFSVFHSFRGVAPKFQYSFGC